MQNVTLISSADNAVEVSLTPIAITPIGKRVADRVDSVLATASHATALALLSQKGTIGKRAGLVVAGQGVVGLIQSASNQNYRPIAEWLAVLINSTVLVRNRAEYEMLPTILDMRIADAEAKGTASGLKMADKLRVIKSDLVEMQAQAQAIFDQKKAAREEARRNAEALAASAGIATDVEVK